jgi:thiamine pyrophosphate-dependent acetolactate synthase large subunit-like protein
MRTLLKQFMDQQLSRREAVSALMAIGFSATAVESVLSSVAEAAPQSAADAFELVGTGGDILAECLKAAGVEYIFDCNSTGQNSFYDALSMRPELNLIVALQEGQATSMAHGYELASGKTAALFVPSIGMPNAMSNLYNAWKDRSSIAVFSDGRDSTMGGRDGFQQIDDWLKPSEVFTKWRWEVGQPERIGEMVRRGIRLAGTPPGGPVYIRIPANVLGTTELKQTIFSQSRFAVPLQMEPRADLIEQAADLLLQAEAPVINAGGEVSRAGAVEDLVELAGLLAIPVAQSLSVYADFPYKNPLFAGFYSMGFPSGIGKTDVFLNLGGPTPDPTIVTGKVPRGAKLINARVEFDKIANTYPTDVPIVAGTKETVRALIDAIESRGNTRRLRDLREQRLDKAQASQSRASERRRRKAEPTWNNSPIASNRLCYEMDRLLDENAIVVVETGGREPQEWMDFGPGRKTLIGPTTGFALGWGIGASLGAKIARPDEQVVTLVGDGAMLFGQLESLWTASRYDIPVTIVVFNNRSYDGERGRLRMFSNLARQDKEAWKDMACYLGNPDVDYLSIAKGFDIEGVAITRPDEIKTAFERAAAVTREGRPVIVDALIARKGPGAESTWHPDISIATRRQMKI